MNYDKKLFDEVLKDTERARIAEEARASALKREIYSKIPRVAEIDAELRGTAFDIIRASFSSGSDPASLIRASAKRNGELQKERAELLVSAGYEVGSTEPNYSCNICNDTGYSGGDPCRCVYEKYKKAKAAEVNRALNLDGVSFDRFDLSLYPEHSDGSIPPRAQAREVLAFCKEYALNLSPASESLLIHGKSGLGKTFLAKCIASEASKRGNSVVFESAYTVCGAYEDLKFGREGRGVSDFENCDLLIVDNLGAEIASSVSTAAFFALLCKRLDAKKPMIVITTLNCAEAESRYGEQTASRLFGSFVPLLLVGDDIRKKR